MDEYLIEFEKLMDKVNNSLEGLFIQNETAIQTETRILFHKVQNGIPITNKEINRYLKTLEREYGVIKNKLNSYVDSQGISFLKESYTNGVTLGKNILRTFKETIQDVFMSNDFEVKMRKVMKSDIKNAVNNVTSLFDTVYKQSRQGLLSETELTYSISQAMIESGNRDQAIQGLTRMFKNKKLGSEYDVSGKEEEILLKKKVREFLSSNKNKTADDLANYVGKLKSNGFIRIIDKNGNPRRYTTEYYSEMIVNQRLAESNIRATLDLSEKNDVYIYEVTSHNSPNFCRVYEGTLHSEKYAGIDNIMGMDTLPTYHVNCKHRIMPSNYEVKK
jgi:hypothetical protein